MKPVEDDIRLMIAILNKKINYELLVGMKNEHPENANKKRESQSKISFLSKQESTSVSA